LPVSRFVHETRNFIVRLLQIGAPLGCGQHVTAGCWWQAPAWRPLVGRLGRRNRLLREPHSIPVPLIPDQCALRHLKGHGSSSGIRQSRATSTDPERSSRADQVPSRAVSTVSVSERSGRRKSGLRPLSEPSPSLPVPTRRQRTPPALAQRKSLAVSPTIHTSDSE
jgi:hypothetical protein